jgi:hypothetical protein
MDAIAFPLTRAGTPFMVSGTHPANGLNDPTSSKQNPDPSTGILVLASTTETDRYWHNWVYLPAARPTVTITAPAGGARLRAGTSVALSGTALSSLDGVITSRLQWISSRDGRLGTGGLVTTTLSAGTHTITASVTDGTRLTGVATITVTVDASALAADGTPPG